MVRINYLSNIKNNVSFKQNKPEISSNQTNPQINELNDVQPDFAVKTPLSYSKIDEVDFPYDTKAYVYKLSNGQKVVIVPQKGETVLKTYVNTGSMNEPDNLRGISHYIEHNLFNGSIGLEEGDFFKQVNKMGASTNASTGLDQTNYYISSNLLDDSDLENKIKLHASMLETPLFAVDKLLKEKDIVNSEINMITSDPQNIAVNKMLKNLYGIETTSNDIVGGTTENINNITREDVVNYFNDNYYPSNMVTVITGEIKPDETIQLISKYFSSKRKPNENRYYEKLEKLDNQVREDIISDKATASSIVVGFQGPKSTDIKDRVLIDALMTILVNSPSARITTKLKQYGANAFAEEEKISSDKNANRALIFSADSTEENSEKVLKDIFNEIGNFANNPPTESEMKIVKKILLKELSTVFEDSFLTNDIIGSSVLDGSFDYIKNYKKYVDEITAQDITNIAKKYLDINKTSTVVVHPSTADKESINKNYNKEKISFTGALKKEAVDLKQVKEYQFDNNYRLLTINSKTDNVNISYKLKTNIDFKSKPSASLVLNELLNEGTLFKDEDNFNMELSEKGIFKHFTASTNGISCMLSCDDKTVNDSFCALKEVLNNPRFTQKDFEHAKEVVKNSILTSEKSASDKLNSELFKGTQKGYSKEELLDSLDELTLDDIKLLYSDILSHSQGLITVSAPFDKSKDLNNVINTNISVLNKVNKFKPDLLSDIYQPITEPKVLVDTDYKNQAEIMQAYKFKRSLNLKDIAAINLMNIILGGNSSSRLFNDLRENEKLAYHVRSNYSTFDDIGVLSLKILTTTDNKETGEKHYDNVQKSIDGFNRHIQKITSEKVSETELNNAKLALKNSILNRNHKSVSQVSVLSNSVQTAYGVNRENLLLEEIDKITVDDIFNAANYIFKNEPVYSILATDDTLKANKEYLDSLI